MVRYVIGNWKMEMSLADSLVLAESLKHGSEHIGGVELIICPSHLALAEVKYHLHPLPPHLHLGAQDGFYEDSGAFTGEVAIAELKPLVSYLLVGHSERKKIGHETSDESRKKIVVALRHEVHPVVFIGEFLRPEGEEIGDEAWKELAIQLEKLIKGLPKEQAERLLVVYEPVWAVGKGGESAQGPYITSIVERMQRELQIYFGADASRDIPILYGGSVSPETIHQVLVDGVSGVVAGRSSLHAEQFLDIARVVAQ